jgi:pimeloyl-ACP methyl ester carboxylesterase
MKKNTPVVLKILKRTTIALFILVAVAFLILWYLSPAKTSPITDAKGQPIPNSIAVIEQPVIGGIEQSLIIRGENTNNPVLLFVHGGPGMSTFPFIKEQFKEMEKLFTICYWDQRGAGKSYSGNIPPESMTLDQFKQDGVEVSQYLIKKFNQQKIYLLGHSWGAYLGSFIIHEHPELYHAYIGIGQVANTPLSEQRSYDFIMGEAKKRNDRKTLATLGSLRIPTAASSSQEWYDYLWIERQLAFEYGAARYGVKRTISHLVKPLLLCREYSISDKLNYQPGIKFSTLHLWKEMVAKNPAELLTTQTIPVYIFQGVHDHQTDFGVAKDYFDHLQAPLKRFYAFEFSAHNPHLEEFYTFKHIIQTEVLGKKD